MTAASTFTNWLLANERSMPRANFLDIKREGRARLVARLQSGEASSVLDFSDLVSLGENAIGGRA